VHREEAENPELDILTGFRVADPHIHLVVLEGLREGAGKNIAQHVCSDVSSGLLFELVFQDQKSRLYFDVTLSLGQDHGSEFKITVGTRSAATAQEPHDALCQLKYCQLLRTCLENCSLKSLQYVHDIESRSGLLEMVQFL